MPKAIIMAGGTGGHIFPALAVAKSLDEHGWKIRWLGTENHMEAQIVPKHGFDIGYLTVSGIRGRSGIKKLFAAISLLKSIYQAITILRDYKPDVVIGFGGYASGPGGLAAKATGVPLFIHEQNAIVGLTNKLLGRVANRVYVAFEQASAFFRQKNIQAQVIGNPIRAEIQPKVFGEKAKRPLRLLVLGGSLGARPLNQGVPALLPVTTDLEILHQAGKNNSEEVAKRYEEMGHRTSTVKDFIDDMAQAYDWADVVVCRAGALTVSEVGYAGLSACFVPLPHAVDDHQTANARALEKHGAAILLPQEKLHKRLPNIVQDWIEHPEHRVCMGQKAQSIINNQAANIIRAACEDLLKSEKKFGD